MSTFESKIGQEADSAERENVLFTSSQMWQLTEIKNPHYFNDGSLLEVRYALDRSLLEQTILHLVSYHDVLRLRFSKDQPGWQQFLIPMQDIQLPVEWIDLSHVPEEEQKEALQTWATRLHTTIDLIHGPTMQVAYFDYGAQKPGHLLWLLNHSIVDYFSFGILLEDFQTVYQQLASGQNVCLPPKTTSFQQWTKRLNEFVQSGEMQHEAEEYWLKAPWHKVSPLPTDRSISQGKNLAESDILKVQLSIEDTSKLLQCVEERHVKIEDVLILSILRVFAQWTGIKWQQICLLNHGRNITFSDIDISRVVGCISLGSRLLLEWRETTTPEHALQSIQEQMAAIPHRGMSFDWLYYLSKYKEKLAHVPPPEIKLNYLGVIRQHHDPSALFYPIDEKADLGREVKITVGREPDDYRKPLSSIHIVATLAGDQLVFFWDYEELLYKRSTIVILAHRCLDYLRSFTDALLSSHI